MFFDFNALLRVSSDEPIEGRAVKILISGPEFCPGTHRRRQIYRRDGGLACRAGARGARDHGTALLSRLGRCWDGYSARVPISEEGWRQMTVLRCPLWVPKTPSDA